MLRRLLCLVYWLPVLLAAQVPSPLQFLGYEPGTRFTPAERVVQYYQAVASAAPNRVVLTQYGESYEGRPLVLATVTSAANRAQLETIRQNNLRRAGLEPGAAPADGPAIVWLSYNIHGNEAVSSEAAMVVLHRLLTDQSGLLDQAVVLLDPCLNPDGRNRYVQHYAQTVGAQPNADRHAREHVEPWPGGRFNHYLFDLNRDWAWQSQQETRQRTLVYRQWMPHVHCDFHEMGYNEPYFFAPAAEPIHTQITPWQREFQRRLGQRNAQVFAQQGWRYFTRESYDLFYPSYGDTWPTFQGAIGMTFEQGGSGQAGLAIRTDDGDTLTLAQRIAHHVATSLATVETAVANREPLLREFAQFFREPAAPAGVRGYWIQGGAPGTPAAEQLWALRQHLDRLNIQYQQVTTSARAVTARLHGSRAPQAIRPQAGDLWVPLGQAQGRLAHVLLEEQPTLPDSLTYDLTAWGLSFAYGLAAAPLAEAPATQPWPVAAGPAPATGPAPVEAYLVPWSGLRSVRFVGQALQAGLKVRCAEEPFERAGQRWPAGTLVLLSAEGGAEWLATVRRLASEAGVTLTDAGPGPSTRGPDFGASAMPLIRNRRVALVMGPGVSPTQAGAVWHYFDQVIGYPVTVLPAEALTDLPAHRLADYDVLVLPSGRYNRLLTTASQGKLLDWVRAGGRLVAMEGAVEGLSRQKDWGLVLRRDTSAQEPSLTARYADRFRNALSQGVLGAILRVTRDDTHPLSFGLPATYYTLKSETLLAPSAAGWNVGYLAADAYVAGFVGGEMRPKLAGSVVWTVLPHGRGHLVALADDPLFRASWPVGWQVVANAVFQPMQ